MNKKITGAGYIFFCSLAIVLTACTSTTTHNNKQAPPTDSLPAQKHEQAAPTERELPILTPQNSEEFLLAYFKNNPERKIKLTTRLGVIKFRLFDDTPIHSANFLMLVKRNYFNNTEFTRIVKKFIVQGGTNEKEEEELKRMLIGHYELPSEIKPHHIHKRGALAMARRYTENDKKFSSAYDFYFVVGQVLNEPQLMAMERDHNIVIPPASRQIYQTVGGAPHLDGEHTVFGEIYEGLNVLKKMSEVETDPVDWPTEPLVIQMEVIFE